MTLNKKQVLFTRLMAEHIRLCSAEGIDLIVAEVHRPPVMAAIYAAPKGIKAKVARLLGLKKITGRGIRNSNHTKKLAFDAFRYKNGTISWEFADYVRAGEIWKGLHPLCRWGGDFIRTRDCPHFSLYHNGVI